MAAPIACSEVDYAARNARVAELFPLVKPIARRVLRSLPPSFELSDLMQAGALGLMAAASRFDPAIAATFQAYAKMKIRGAMLDLASGKEYRESTRPPLEHVAISPRAVEPSPEALAQTSERARTLRRAVRKLTPRQRKVIRLRYRKELTQKQAGVRLDGISQAGARALEIRALKRLKVLLAKSA